MLDAVVSLIGGAFDKVAGVATSIYGSKVASDQTQRQYELQQQQVQYQLAQQATATAQAQAEAAKTAATSQLYKNIFLLSGTIVGGGLLTYFILSILGLRRA